MIPEFDPTTKRLPVGIHETTWKELAAHFGTTPARGELLDGMRDALRALAFARCSRVYIGGSFTSDKAKPGDWDGCYEGAGVLEERLPGSILEESQARMKLNYRGEIYRRDDEDFDFLSFFQLDKQDRPVGVLALDPHTAQ